MTLLTDIITDADTMFDSDDYAQNAILSIDGDESSVRVIVDESYQAINTVSGEVESTTTSCLVRDADISGLQQGDSITLNETLYDVVEIQPEGDGLSTLILSEDSRHG